MPKIIHFDDAPAPGGVTRVIEMLIGRFGGVFCSSPMSRAWKTSGVDRADLLVVHASSAWSKLPFLAALRLRNRSGKIIVIEHHYTRSFEGRCVPQVGRFRALLACSYGLVDHIVAVSHGQAQWMRDARLVPDHKVTVIPCVVDLTPFERLSLPHAHGGPLRLGALGRLHPQKGFEVLIEAMREIPADVATLEIAGTGPLEAELKALAAPLPNVRFRSWTEPAAFYAEVDAIVMPSLWEPGAVACWEARAAGRPMIVSDVDGLPEQVPPEVGFVTAAGDSKALAAAIRALASADRAKQSEAARRSTSGAFERAMSAWASVLVERQPRDDSSRATDGRSDVAAAA